MRVWDVDPKLLCPRHLVAEHRELHGIYSILLNDKKGYRNHPETKRWVGKLPALYARHEQLVALLKNHNSPLPPHPEGKHVQDEFVDPLERQIEILKAKPCKCRFIIGSAK